MSLREISEVTGLGLSAVQRFVYTLKTLGYICQESSTKRYSLAPRVLDLSHGFMNSNELIKKSTPFLRETNRQTNQTINLQHLDGIEILYLLRFASRNDISVHMAIGSRLPAYCTAGGWAILAHLSTEEIDEILSTSDLKQLTPHTTTDKKKILRKLEDVKKNGYAVNNQETFIGDLNIAAPVLSRDKKPVAAINFALKTPRWSVERAVNRYCTILTETAHAISASLD